LRVTRPHRRGFPCFGRFPFTHMPAPLPRRDRGGVVAHRPPHDGGLPCDFVRSAPALHFSRPAQRSLIFRPACSPSRPRRPSTPKASTGSLPPLPLRLLPAGATSCRAGISPAENRRLFTAHKNVGVTKSQEEQCFQRTSCGFVTQTIPRTSRTRWPTSSRGIIWATRDHLSPQQHARVADHSAGVAAGFGAGGVADLLVAVEAFEMTQRFHGDDGRADAAHADTLAADCLQ